MTNTSRYMQVLAKVVGAKDSEVTKAFRDKYNRLYYMISTDLNEQLRKSLYPYTSDIAQKNAEMLDLMEVLYNCPELIEKKCLMISSHITTSIFSWANSLFVNKEYISAFRRIYTQIPFIIVNQEDDNTIELLNYANVRVQLSESEFKFLVIESGKRKIALNKIVRYVFLKTKLVDSQICIISDNIYSDAKNMFSRAVSKELAFFDEEGLKNFAKRNLKGVTTLVMNDNLLESHKADPFMKKYRHIRFCDIEEYIKKEVRPVLYGFLDEFTSISSQISVYYEKQKLQTKKTLQDVVGDIVRIGDVGNETLSSIRKFEEQRANKIENEEKTIAKILSSIEELVIAICVDLGDNRVTGKQISRHVFDDVFESIFNCSNLNTNKGKQLLARLYSYEYDNYSLVSTYVESLSGSKVSFEQINIEISEWEKAKMLLHILEPENISKTNLELYVRALGKHCHTGKELFAKSLTFPGDTKVELLQESFDKGYEKAGIALLEMYKNGDKAVNILSLANALVPEACMILADRKMEEYQSKKYFADICDKEFTYYKIAAAKQYIPAIGKIVDIVYESRFSSGYQIPKDEMTDDRHEVMIENGHVVCQLCRFLISKMYFVNHYSEILGIVLFSLNENLSESMSLLGSSNSSLACYCKGNMYEFGNGVAMDLEQAISNYEQSVKKGCTERALKRLTACRKKKERNDENERNDSYYQASRSYHSTSTYSSSYTYDDGCFAPGTQILKADKTCCSVECIKKGDRVIVFDHYRGVLCESSIVANVHETSSRRTFDIINLNFASGRQLKIVKSHALFDMTDNCYVWIDSKSVENYIGHKFASYEEGSISEDELIDYKIEIKDTHYYVPISQYHLNVFAENMLTIPPTKISVNLFDIDENMQYDLSILERKKELSYEDLSSVMSLEEFESLPCKYWLSIKEARGFDDADLHYVLALYRT